MENIRDMTAFHRFCAVFPLLILVLTLAACGTGRSPWQKQTGADSGSSVYGGSSVSTFPAAPAGTPGAVGQVKVAILLPLSGNNAGVGQSMLQAAQLAIFDLGYDNFELMPRDTGGTPQGAAQAANSAMTDGAQLILGPLFAEEVRSVKSTTAGRGVNVIAFSTDWSLAGGNTYIMGFLPFEQVERIADYASTHGVKRAAVVSNADQYGSTVATKFETEAAERGIAITRGLSDPSAYDAVFIPAGGNDLNTMLMRVPNKSAQKLGTGLWDDARLAANPAMNGAWFAAPSPSARAGFESRYQSTFGGMPVRIATLAYDATALAAALAKSGFARNGKPAFDAGSLTSASGFAGVDGIIRFTKGNLAERGMAVLGIQNGRIVELEAAPRAFAQ
jgi:branched-chain amino acid transport system substrate-binding protein